MQAKVTNLNGNIHIGRELRDRSREAIERPMYVADETDQAR
jgi:hypothetical protein